jgi:hypothetical protein
MAVGEEAEFVSLLNICQFKNRHTATNPETPIPYNQNCGLG